jgi:RimJ/RimL family protein N-acetyltransferase
MPLLTDRPGEVADFVADRAHAPDGYENYQAVGVVDQDGTIVAGMVFESWNRHSVNIHLAIDDPSKVALGFYKYCFRYAFETMGCHRINAMCVDGYERNERLLEGMCFKREGVLREGWRLPDGQVVDAAIYGCLRSECRLIPKELRHDEA